MNKKGPDMDSFIFLKRKEKRMSLFTNYGKDFKRSKYLSDMIDILSEQDFNPDLVIGGA